MASHKVSHPDRGREVKLREINSGTNHEEEDRQKNRWEMPSMTEAMIESRKLIFRNGRASFWNTRLLELGSMGSGMMLYFVLLKWFGFLFLGQTILYLPALVFFSRGKAVSQLFMDPLGLTTATLANFQSPSTRTVLHATYLQLESWSPSLASMITVPESDEEKEFESYIVSGLDFFSSVIFIFFIFRIRARVQQLVLEADLKFVTPSDFSVCVEGLPSDVTKDEVIEHFSALYKLDGPDWEWKGFKRGKFISKESRPPVYHTTLLQANGGMETLAQPVTDCSNSGDPRYLGKWVCEVTVVSDSRELILKCKSGQQLLRDFRETSSFVKKYSSEEFFDARMLKREKDRMKQLQTQILKLRDWIKAESSNKKKWTNSLSAYVIFKHRESFERCIEDYSKTDWQHDIPTPLRLRGEHPLRVSIAQEPTNIKWENVYVPRSYALLYSSAVNAFTVFLLLLAFLLLFGVHMKLREIQQLLPDQRLCSIDLPAKMTGRFAAFEEPPLIVRNASLDKYCQYGKIWLSYDGIYSAEYLKRAIENKDRGTVWSERYDKCLSPCIQDPRGVRTATTTVGEKPTKCFTLSVEEGCPSIQSPPKAGNENTECKAKFANESLSFGATVWKSTLEGAQDWSDLASVIDGVSCCKAYDLETTMRYCYCSQRYSMSGLVFKIFIFATSGHATDICSDHFVEEIFQRALQVAPALIVGFVNISIRLVMRWMISRERKKTVTEEELSLTSRVFASQFLNTAILAIILHSTLPNEYTKQPQSTTLVDGEEMLDFSKSWYLVVGQMVTLSLAFNGIGQFVFPMLTIGFTEPIRQVYTAVRAATQPQLNRAFSPPTFQLTLRYSTLLNVIFVALMYSSSMPILVPMTSFYFFSTFLFFKYGLLRFYRKPPAYDGTLPVLAINALPYALLFHCAFAFWAFGNENLMVSRSFISSDMIAALDNPTSAASVYDDVLLFRMLKGDRLGILRKALRVSAFPHFFLTLLVGLWVIVSEIDRVVTFFSAIAVAVKRTLPDLRSRIQHSKIQPTNEEQNKVTGSMEERLSSIEALPNRRRYFGLLKTIAQALKTTSSVDAHESNPPYTDHFIRLMPKTADHTSQQKRQNWRTWESSEGERYEFCVSETRDGPFHHPTGQRFSQGILKTWQVIAMNSVHSYDMSANPQYKGIAATINMLSAAKPSTRPSSKRRSRSKPIEV